MTEIKSNKKTKLRAFLALLFTLLLSFTVFFVVACDDNTADDTTTTYTKTETDNSIISNGSFEFGTADTDIGDLPKTTSITGWGSVSTENSSATSRVSSGIISVEEDAWEKLVKKLYDNSTFKSKLNSIYGIDADTLSEEEVLENLKTKNPSVYVDEHGNKPDGSKIYMLNSYTSDDWHTAVTAISTSTVTMNKGSFAKITFWVYTQYANGGDYKINFRLKNTVNSNSQTQYVISGIGTESWKQYSVYLKSDKNFSSSFTVVLSAGLCDKSGNVLNLSEGTAFFDDIKYTELTETEFNDETTEISDDCIQTLKYGSKVKVLTQNAGDKTSFIYDTSVNTSSYFNDVNFLDSITTYDFTGKTETSEKKFGFENSNKGTLSTTANSITVSDIKNASVSVKVQNDSYLSVAPEEYLLLSFKINNNLNKSGSTNLTILVYDEKGNENNVVSFSDADDGETKFLSILNNDKDSPKYFYIVVVIGPTDVKGTSSMYDFASGEVALTEFKYSTGKTYQYEKDSEGNIISPKTETDNYNLYNLYSSVASSVRIDDYVADSTDTYYLSPAKSYGGSIQSSPVAVEKYRGVSYNSIYVSKDGTNNDINSRTGVDGDGNGNYAGLINSKVNYSSISSIDINSALNYNGEKTIQPIMIYNSTEDSYGFIGKSFTVAASAYAAISVKVKAIGDAKANIYIVNAADSNKSVYTFNFTGNVKNNSYEQKFSAPLSFTDITSSKMSSDGWTTITFYIATGASALDLRLELWNGSRDGEQKSQGFVFFAFDSFEDGETFTPSTLSSAFTEPSSVKSAFTQSGNPLYDNAVNKGETALRDNNLKYKRELDATEIKFNKERPDEAVSYDETYVWAKSDNVIYAIYNTVNPVSVDPYRTEEDELESGCAAETDPSTFWLSFSSILLGVALVVAIFMLVIKNVRRRNKANKSDAKSHYNVSSRHNAKTKKPVTKVKKADKPDKFEGYEEESSDNIDQPIINSVSDNDEVAENSDEYVYGDVQDFGDNDKDGKTE